MRRIFSYQDGTALSEYMLGGILVGIVSIGALSLTSGSFGDLLGSIQGDASSQAQTAKNQSTQSAVIVGLPTANLTSSGVPAAGGAAASTGTAATQPATLSSLAAGNYMSNYPSDLTQSIETAGANGTTLALLNTMFAYTQQQLQNGTITQEQANQINQLANQGHRLADIMGVLDKAVKDSGNDPKKFEDMMVSYGGRTMSAGEMGKLLDSDDVEHGSHLYDNNVTGPDGSKFTCGDELASFFNLLSSVDKNGSLDPNTKMVINVLSSQIAQISNAVGGTAFNIAYVSTVPKDATKDIVRQVYDEDLSPNLAQDLNSLPAATLAVNTKSTQICNAGGYTDTGEKCK